MLDKFIKIKLRLHCFKDLCLYASNGHQSKYIFPYSEIFPWKHKFLYQPRGLARWPVSFIPVLRKQGQADLWETGASWFTELAKVLAWDFVSKENLYVNCGQFLLLSDLLLLLMIIIAILYCYFKYILFRATRDDNAPHRSRSLSNKNSSTRHEATPFALLVRDSKRAPK